MAQLGVRVYEQATAVSVPNVAKVGIPYFVGTAPVHTAEKPAKVNAPVLATSWDEAVEKLGFSYDWKNYSLCEAMYSHFQLFGCQPAIFCNVLDPAKKKTAVAAKSYPVTDHKAVLPIDAMDLKVQAGGEVGGEELPADKAAIQREGDLKGTAYDTLMADDVRILADGRVVGAIPYVTGFTGFSSAPAEQKGHYVVIHFGGNGEIKYKRNGVAEERNLGAEDRDLIVLLDNGFETMDVTVGSDTKFKLDFTSLTLLPEGQTLDLAPDADFTISYDAEGGACVIELLSSGEHYGDKSVCVGYDAVTPGEVEEADIVEGVGQVDAAMTAVGTVPDLICVPGWSQKPVVAAVMATKASAISGLFRGKAVVDIDSGAEGVTSYDRLSEYKTKNNLVDADQILCWPMVKLGEHTFHLSTQLCGLMARVDAENRGVPYESPSNKNLQIDACCLEDGTEVNLTWPQVEMVSGDWGVVTAVNFMDSGWVAKGNYTACFPGSADVKDQFIPVSRMFDFIGNTLIRTFWPKQDKPLTTPLRDSIIQSCNIWLGGLCGSGYLYGARCVLLAEENPLDNLLAGHITLHVYNAPPVPAQRIDFILEYDVSYMETALLA